MIRSISKMIVPALAGSLLACDSHFEAADADADAEVSTRLGGFVPLAPAPEPGPTAPGDERPLAPTVARFEGRASARWSPERVQALIAESQAALAEGHALTLAALAPPADTRWFVHEGALVLAEGEAVDARWLTGPARPLTLAVHDFGATRDLDLARLPPHLRAVVNTQVKVYGPDREVCVASVSGLSVEARLVHGPDGWPNYDDDGKELPPEPITYTASEVFEQGLTLVKAELEPLFGDCGAGLWATPVEAKRPVLYRELDEAIAPALARKATRAFRQTHAWAEAQRGYRTFFSDTPPSGRWDTLRGTRPEVERLLGSDGSELLMVWADSWDGCGSEGQSATTVFRVDGDALALVTEIAGRGRPTGLVDLDGDGTLEVFDHNGADTSLYRWVPGAALPSDANDWTDERSQGLGTFSIPDLTMYGCGC